MSFPFAMTFMIEVRKQSEPFGKYRIDQNHGGETAQGYNPFLECGVVCGKGSPGEVRHRETMEHDFQLAGNDGEYSAAYTDGHKFFLFAEFF